MTGYPLRDRLALLAGLAGPFLVALLLVPFRTDLSRTNAALILVVAVVAVAALGSRVAGALAALSAAAWFDFFLTRPYQTFDINTSADVETAVLLLVVGLIVSQLAARARRLEVITVTDADHLRTYGNGHYLGRFMLTPGPGSVPPLRARLVAVTLADQTGTALDTAGPVKDG
ncbi:DUF4118 domain-containing protein [Streptomyces umbrinus]|uniref:DUF4118 domain-containing protein n=1 Tax=Streptomyces umbrinus TaxID=67370 RepID=UPI00167DDE9A|nr:DUF4118 domain-containing protein [Streptomyces umbrinus]